MCSSSRRVPQTATLYPIAGRDKVKMFGAWLDADVVGRKAGQGNRAAALLERVERGETLSDAEQAEVRDLGTRIGSVVV